MGKRGFTLIELLVVVLIIGILASVAVVQYQKAMKRTRMAELTVLMDSAKKNLEMYLMTNGYPSGTIILSAAQNVGQLPLDLPATCNEASYCTTKIGNITLRCASSYCDIRFQGTNSLSGIGLTLYKGTSTSNNWIATKLGAATEDDVYALCNWLLDAHYPVDAGQLGGDMYRKCKRIDVELEPADFS